ncbi:MAG: hypothetical protein AAF598_04810 [Bacteroidota bacterium]
MKSIIILLSLCLGSISFLSAQDWKDEEKTAFITSCVKEAEEAMGKSMALQYCYCMMDKVIDLEKKGANTSKLTEKEVMPLAEGCLTLLDKWDNPAKEGFLSSCINAAKEGMTEEEANSYCNCMLPKIIPICPDPTKCEPDREIISKFADSCLH